MGMFRSAPVRFLPPLLALLCVALAAFAGTNTISIVLNANAWSIGTVSENGVADTWLYSPGNFAVSNDSSCPITLYISVSNSTPDGWTPGPTPGFDVFTMSWSPGDSNSIPQYAPIQSVPAVMVGMLDTNDVATFDLQFCAPVETATTSTQQIGVTILAVEAE